MSIIEGVGDEVTQFFIGLIFVIVGLIAWWTTRVTENVPLRTVYLFEQQLRVFTQSPTTYTDNLTSESQNANSAVQSVQSSATNTSSAGINEENKPPEASSSVDTRPDRGGSELSRNLEEEEQSAIVQTMDSSDSNVLRNRRIAFFHLRNDTLIDETSNASSSATILNAAPNDDTRRETKEETKTTEPKHDTETQNDEPEEETKDKNDITIKLKYINDDLKLVSGKLQEQLGDFKRRHFETELSTNKLVRLIFNGQVLQKDNDTLQACGMFDNCVVHCLVHQRRSTPAEAAASAVERDSENTDNSRRLPSQGVGAQGRECDFGNLLFGLASFILGIAWYFRYEYAQLYTVTTTIALVGLTGVFTVLFVGMYFPDPDPPPPAQTPRT